MVKLKKSPRKETWRMHSRELSKQWWDLQLLKARKDKEMNFDFIPLRPVSDF